MLAHSLGFINLTQHLWDRHSRGPFLAAVFRLVFVKFGERMYSVLNQLQLT